MGRKKGRWSYSDMTGLSSRDIDKSSFFSDVLLRARLAKPCGYCHVPYHHRLAPFTNMRLVPCMMYVCCILLCQPLPELHLVSSHFGLDSIMR